MAKKHIILIGMPACGKSTVGVLAAKALGYAFVDADLVIQARAGGRLQELIDRDGIPAFLSLEEEVNLTLGNDDTPTIIATGGSAIYREAAMEHFRKVGTVVYLELSYRAVEYRLGDFSKRGVVMPEGYTLRRLYDERCALCERYADITIHEGRHDRISDVADAVVAHFRPAEQS